MFIDDLKKSILQKAIQGKLVEQNSNDEPASELLKRINKEKERLIRDGKIKKEKPLAPIKDEEKLFDIPSNWEWVRLGEISNLNIGKTPDRKNSNYWSNGTVNWFSISDMDDCKEVSDTKEKISDVAIKDCFKNGITSAGTLIMSFKLTIGKTSILGMNAVFNEAIVSILPLINDKFITRNYLLKILPMLAKDGNTKNAIKGATLNKESLNNLILPLPPLEEQERIIIKLDDLMSLVDEARPLEEEIIKLEKEFPGKLRKALLQYAIQGKLVEQNSNDEPASDLLRKIKEEKERLVKGLKIKKGKKTEPISDDEKSFDIPNSWEWVRLNDVVKKIFAGGDKPERFSKEPTDELMVPVIANGETNDGLFGYTDVATVNVKSLTVAGRGTIGFSVIRDYPYTPIVRLIVIEGLENISLEYLKIVIQASLVKGNGSAIPQLTVPMISPLPIPLPPLEEQKRIVAKVDELMKLCNELEEQVNNLS